MLNKERVTVTFSRSEALVIFEFLSRFTDTDELVIQDQAEERVLWDMCAQLEKILAEPFEANWDKNLQRARDEIRDAD